MQVKQGQILAVTQGEYSDYCLKDHFRALVDFDTNEFIQKYKEQFPDGDSDRWKKYAYNKYDQDRFLAWCVEQKLIEVLSENEVQEWYIGSYGDLSND